MGSSVPVRCPACRRDHAYEPPVFPCACGAPLAPPLQRDAPAQTVTHRTWTDSWVTVRCESCGRNDQWPQPELGCGCGAVLRIPVRPAPTVPPTAEPAGRPAMRPESLRTDESVTASASDVGAGPGVGAGPDTGAHPDAGADAGTPRERSRAPRPPFRPLTIRTARDAVTAAALYLKWLGFRGILQSPEHPASGIDLRAPGLVAQVDPSTEPSTLRDVECLWLHGLNQSSVAVFFSLTGYEPAARARAEELGVPLFVLDLTGTPKPATRAADDLAGSSTGTGG
ncbi:hypothetical protein GCM10010329_24570 [Streptomyces spiroverticillatus]|uniref:Restriction endonuclease type IV Mrr domain-containing protein n=1 Tax=Streptomyces finlayi TaxID=67296 RepID=A0A919C8H8_9ACTN|nr:hypothetical protein [Streptomyces finlayi]GHA01888.1 hypothetical protein GCM10010329_24570 [Streptomyces spiroverticillatus]GHC86157.1 hypothetical protein GCM10010334_16990 [Streptomyces finlayi]